MKNLSNLGTALNKAEQKTINGGGGSPRCYYGFCTNNGEPCSSSNDCEWEEEV